MSEEVAQMPTETMSGGATVVVNGKSAPSSQSLPSTLASTTVAPSFVKPTQVTQPRDHGEVAPGREQSRPHLINGHSHKAHQHDGTDGQAKTGESLPNLGEAEAKCGGCDQVIDPELGGVVVAFGTSLWHVDCFRCAKCNEKVSADTNLLLLSNGKPVCGSCSYLCTNCGEPITEEAIMTGDESYHANCFTCKTCKRRIDELVFAKTSQGIYCMACHNDRVARSRRHAEQRRQRAARKEKERKEKENGSASGLESAWEGVAAGDKQPAIEKDGKTDTSKPIPSNRTASPQPPSNLPPLPTLGSPIPPTGVSPSFNSPAAVSHSVSSPRLTESIPISTTEPLSVRSRELSVDKLVPRASSPIGRIAEQMPLPASPSESSQPASRSASAGGLNGSPQSKKPQSSTTPIIGSVQSSDSRSSPFLESSPSRGGGSVNTGANAGLGVGPVWMEASGLGVPSTSKADRRRSINPGMTFSIDPQNGTYSAVDSRVSNLPPSPIPSPLRASFTDLQEQQRSQQLQRQQSPTSPTAKRSREPSSKTSLTPSIAQKSIADDPFHPPRTSSLPEGLSTVEQTPVNGHSTVKSGDREEATPTVKGNGESGKNLPDMRPVSGMSFSLSDPDFALILNRLDESPNGISLGEKSPDAVVAVSAVRPDTTSVTRKISPSSAPTSPTSMIPRATFSPPLERPSHSDSLKQVTEPVVTPSASSRDLSSSDKGKPSSSRSPTRSRLSPSAANGASGSTPHLLRTRQPSAESTMSVNSRLGVDSAYMSLVELVGSAKHSGDQSVPVDLTMLNGIIGEIEDMKDTIIGLKNKYTGAKRTSQQYSEGLTVAGEEYDKELAHRQELEGEVKRLRAQVHSQTARLSVISGDERRQENMRRRSHDLASSLTGLERDISRLRAQRDMTLAEVEELNSNKNSTLSEETASALSRSLTNRLDTIKEQYREELEPLTAQREALQREIADLRETKDQFLEESTALAAKNEELAELNASLTRQNEVLQDSLARGRGPTVFQNKIRTHPSGSPSLSSLATSATLQEVPEETAKVLKAPKPETIEAAPARRFKWNKFSKGPDVSSTSASISKPLALMGGEKRGGGLPRPSTEYGFKDHSFQQHSTMRFTRCDVCQEKMWGLQEVKCTSCGLVCHAKCAEKIPRSCTGARNGHAEVAEDPAGSLFGRDLTEQTVVDDTEVPVIVSKCIAAVEVVGMEYEGIYRKTGGSSQSKQITQLFERGNYNSFDLADIEEFNDISSVTSVFKTYLRQLPDPLLTHALHESFIAAATIKDPNNKHSALCALVQELPKSHYNTLRAVMLHLNRVTTLASVNKMTTHNVGIVFGPTLMKSSDPSREFADMAGKAQTIQWMAEFAQDVFRDPRE